MAIGGVLSGLLMVIREDARLLKAAWYRVPEMLAIGGTGARMNVGISWSLLSIGSGMLVGMRINTSMVIGMILGWVVAPPLLLQQGWVAHMVRREMLLWVLWPAVGVLIAGGLAKGQDLAPLAAGARGKLRAAVLIGDGQLTRLARRPAGC